MTSRTGSLPPRALVLDVDGVLTDGTVAVSGGATRRVHLRDLDALTRARAAGIRVAFLTGESADEMADVVARCGGGPTRYSAKDKVTGLRALAGELAVEIDDVCYLADARRDAAALRIAGLGLVPADGDPEAKRCAARVLVHAGGRGAVAEAVDLLLGVPPAAEDPVSPSVPIKEGAAEAVELLGRFVNDHLPDVERLARLLTQALDAGGSVLLFGNGGSAAMAQHAATELVCRFRLDREPLRAIALTGDTAVVTAIANDWKFDEIFRRQINGLGQPGDLAVALSTSGTSSNVLLGLGAARTRGLATVLLTGASPDAEAARACDLCIRVPSQDVARIQELHLLTWHLACGVVEEGAFAQEKHNPSLPKGADVVGRAEGICEHGR